MLSACLCNNNLLNIRLCRGLLIINSVTTINYWGDIPAVVYSTLECVPAKWHVFVSGERLLVFKAKVVLFKERLRFKTNIIPSYHIIDTGGKVKIDEAGGSSVIYYIEKYREAVDVGLPPDETYNIIVNYRSTPHRLIKKYKEFYSKLEDAEDIRFWYLPDETDSIKNCFPLEVHQRMPPVQVYCTVYYNMLQDHPEYKDDPVFQWHLDDFCDKIEPRPKPGGDKISDRYATRKRYVIPDEEHPGKYRSVKRRFKCNSNCPNLPIIEKMRSMGLPPGTRHGYETSECSQCGKEFVPTSEHRRYCSEACRTARQKINRRENVIADGDRCRYCGKLLKNKRANQEFCRNKNKCKMAYYRNTGNYIKI